MKIVLAMIKRDKNLAKHKEDFIPKWRVRLSRGCIRLCITHLHWSRRSSPSNPERSEMNHAFHKTAKCTYFIVDLRKHGGDIVHTMYKYNNCKIKVSPFLTWFREFSFYVLSRMGEKSLKGTNRTFLRFKRTIAWNRLGYTKKRKMLLGII